MTWFAIVVLIECTGWRGSAAEASDSLLAPPSIEAAAEAEDLAGRDPAGDTKPLGAASTEQTQSSTNTEEEETDEYETWIHADDYDPWAPFNERMFWFNHRVLDRFVMKPAATAWDRLLPDTVQRRIGNAFDNLGTPSRFVNNLLQGTVVGASRELARLVVNTTVGVAGLFDVADSLHIEKSPADAGQTLGVYGAAPGPYLVLPMLPPLSVRDAIGFAADGFMDPLSYVLPFGASVGRTAVDGVNERSLNLELFDDVEASSLDLYSAVRNGYLQRRRKFVEEGREEFRRRFGGG